MAVAGKSLWRMGHSLNHQAQSLDKGSDVLDARDPGCAAWLAVGTGSEPEAGAWAVARAGHPRQGSQRLA